VYQTLSPSGGGSGDDGMPSSGAGIIDFLTLLTPAPPPSTVTGALGGSGAASNERDDGDGSAAAAPRQPAVVVAESALIALLDRHQVGAAATLSTSALHHDAAAGNRDTLAVCRSEPRLYPAFVLDPRLPDREPPSLDGARMACLMPITQHYPAGYAPLRRLLRHLSQSAPNLPLLFEATRPGDATTFAGLLRETNYAGPVILSDVSGGQAATLAEALALAEENPTVYLATDGLCGIGEVAAAVAALGAPRIVFASGAPARSPGAALAVVRHARLSPGDEALVLGGNARRLLGDRMSRAAALIDNAVGDTP